MTISQDKKSSISITGILNAKFDWKVVPKKEIANDKIVLHSALKNNKSR